MPTGGSVTVNLSYSGTATDGSDYTGVTSVVIPAGSDNATFTLATIDDAFVDDGETIIIDIASVVDTNSSFEAVGEGTNNQLTTRISDEGAPGPEDTVLANIAGPGSVVEGDTTTNYTVTLDETVPTGGSVTVNLSYSGTATDGSDYTGVTSVVIPAGSDNITFTIDTLDDVFADDGETIIIDIASVVDTNSSFEAVGEGTNNQVTTTINDEGTPGPEDTVLANIAGPGSVVEGETTTDYTVTLDETVPTGGSVTVNLSYSGTATDGSDYTGVTSVVIPAGSDNATFTLPTIGDAFADDGETIIIDIASVIDTNNSFEAVGEGTNNQITTTINDTGGTTVLASIAGPGTVVEGETTTDYTVTLDETVPTGGSVTVNLSYSGTAIDGSDYTGVTSVVIPAGSDNATFTLPTIDDAFVDDGETIIIDIASVVDTNSSFEAVGEGTSNQVTTTINDEGAPGPEDTVLANIAGPGSVVEGETTTDYTVTLDETVPTGGSVTVNLSYSGTATDGTDYTGVTSVVIPAGSDNATFTLPTIDDAFVDDGETIIIDIASVVDTNSSFEAVGEGTSNQVTTTINDEGAPGPEDTVLANIAGPGSVVEGETTTDYTVTLDETVPTGGSVTVNLSYSGTATDGTDYTGVTSVVIPAGSDNTTFTLPTIDDSFADDGETIIIDIASVVDTNSSFEAVGEGTSNQVTTTINDEGAPGPEDTVLANIAGPGSVVEGETTTDYTVTLDETVPAGGSVTVNLSYSGTATDGSDYTGVTSVVIPAGSDNTTFSLPTIDDAFADNGETIIIDIASVVDTNSSFEAVGEGTNNQVTTTINDEGTPGPEDTVLVNIAGPASVLEGDTTTDYTLTLDETVPTGGSVTVNLSYSGTATDGSDYTGVTSVVIPAGSDNITFTIDTLDDVFADDDETIIIDIASVVDTNGSFEAVGEGTNNQITTTITDQLDTDGDGEPDVTDLDDDNDGILDTVESPGGSDVDTDGDNVVDRLDLDSDNDGISDLEESGADRLGLDPDNNGVIDGAQFADTDTDGLADAIEATNGNDIGTAPAESTADADTTPNHLDLDSDGDGIPDAIEAQVTSTYAANFGNDGDVTNDDSDGDGILDIYDDIASCSPTAFRSPVRNLGDGPVSDTQNVDLSSTGVMVGGSLTASTVRARGDLNNGTEVFSLSFNGGTVFGGLTTGAECGPLLAATPAVNAMITAVDIGGGTPGVAIQAITPAAIDAVCDGNTVGLQYTVDFLCQASSGSDHGGTFNTPQNTDDTDNPDYLDTNSDNDNLSDNVEGGSGVTGVSFADPDGSVDDPSNLPNGSGDTSEVAYREVPPDVEVSIAGPSSVVEGATTTDYTVTLDEAVPAGNSVTVNLSYSGTAADGTDYTGVTSVVIPGGSDNVTFTIPTLDDAFADDGETIIVDIASVVDNDSSFGAITEGTNNQVTTTINDEGTPGPEDTVLANIAGPGSVVEGNTTTNYTVTLDETVPTGGSVTVNLSYSGTATDGTDYTGITSVVIPAGSNNATFTLPTIDDAFADDGEAIIIDIASVVDTNSSFEAVGEGVNNQVTTTINDEGTPGPEDTVLANIAGPGSVVEGDTTTNYTVTLDETVPTGGSVTVNLSYSGTATDGTDYTGVTSVVIPAGSDNTTFTLPTIDDSFADDGETIIIDIASVVDTNSSFEAVGEGVNNQVTTTISDETPPSVALQARVMLQGALNVPGGYTFTTIMRDALRQADQAPSATTNFLPDTEPYTNLGFTHVGGGGETVVNPATVFADNGNDSIVDWVFVELRDASDNTAVIATRAGLVQRDGDVVDVDGVSPLVFSSTAAADYFVSINHRNHLGVMTEATSALSSIPTVVDFTDPGYCFISPDGVGMMGLSNSRCRMKAYRHCGQVMWLRTVR